MVYGAAQHDLWDLADGTRDGLPDTDADGIALGPAAVLEAMIAHGAEEGAYPSLPSFLPLSPAARRAGMRSLTSLLGTLPKSISSSSFPERAGRKK